MAESFPTKPEDFTAYDVRLARQAMNRGYPTTEAHRRMFAEGTAYCGQKALEAVMQNPASERAKRAFDRHAQTYRRFDEFNLALEQTAAPQELHQHLHQGPEVHLADDASRLAVALHGLNDEQLAAIAALEARMDGSATDHTPLTGPLPGTPDSGRPDDCAGGTGGNANGVPPGAQDRRRRNPPPTGGGNGSLASG